MSHAIEITYTSTFNLPNLRLPRTDIQQGPRELLILRHVANTLLGNPVAAPAHAGF